MAQPPKLVAGTQKELEKLDHQFDSYKKQLDNLTLDEMNKAPLKEEPPQIERSVAETRKIEAPYIKPVRSISGREKFNEKYRSDWEHDKQYVLIEAENKMIIGEQVEMWTKPYAGIPAEFWNIPVNKPINVPRYVANQIKGAKHHELHMDDTKTISSDAIAEYQGVMVAKKTIQRLDARKPEMNLSISMGKHF